MTILCRSCKTAKIAFKTKVVAEVSKYPLNLKTVKLKVSKPAKLCSVLTFLRLWQLLSGLMCLEQKVRHSLRHSTFEEIRIVYLTRMTSLQKKKSRLSQFHFC